MGRCGAARGKPGQPHPSTGASPTLDGTRGAVLAGGVTSRVGQLARLRAVKGQDSTRVGLGRTGRHAQASQGQHTGATRRARWARQRLYSPAVCGWWMVAIARWPSVRPSARPPIGWRGLRPERGCWARRGRPLSLNPYCDQPTSRNGSCRSNAASNTTSPPSRQTGRATPRGGLFSLAGLARLRHPSAVTLGQLFRRLLPDPRSLA